jgi:2-polyprenyl-3-methyl-5-hydroxy-6-metoxy-1,4-benzoquinol methylase
VTERSIWKRIANRNLPRTRVVDRRPFLIERCAGRHVLHLGCVDWPYLDQKLAAGTLIHTQMAERASRLVGLDIDQAGVEIFQKRGWPCIRADVEELPELAEPFDLVVAGEILEHLANPGRFLTSLARRLPDTEVILTTPNAYAARRYWRFLLGHEQVHPNHVAYYSPLTLREILRRHRYAVQELYAYGIGREFTDVHWGYRAFEQLGTLVEPWTADGLIAVAKTPAS